MQPDRRVLGHAVVEAGRLPGVREEAHADRLPEVVQLQPARADRVHDARVVDAARRDAQRARAQQQVRVRRRPERVAHDQERHVFRRRVAQDLVRARLDQLADREQHGAPVEGFLRSPSDPARVGRGSVRTSFSFSIIRMLVYASR